MKKKIFVLILFILLIPTIVFAKDTCNSNDIKIKSITLKELKGFVEEKNASSINNNIIILNLKLYDVGDYITYNIVVENTSNNNYYFSKDSMKIENDYLEYFFKKENEIIPAKSEKEIELKVLYKNKINNDNYSDVQKISILLSDKPLENPKTNINYYILLVLLIILIPIFMKYHKKGLIVFGVLGIVSNVYALCTVNIDIETNIEIDNKEAIFLPGLSANIKMKELAGDDTSIDNNGYNFKDVNITSIKYSTEEPGNNDKEDKNIVSILESPYPIYMWYDNGIIYWWSEDSHPSLNSDSVAFMYNMSSLTNIDSISNWDASSVENMKSMFNATALSELSALKKWDVSNVKILSYTFSHMEFLTDISGLLEWNISNVSTLQNTFSFDTSLVKLNGLEKWDTSNVNNFNLTFAKDTSLISLEPLKNWDTSSVEIISSMFALDSSIRSLSELRNWDMYNVKNFGSMFAGCSGLKNLKGLENWNVSKGELFVNMFNSCNGLEDTNSINDWNISSNSDFYGMFNNLTIHPEFSKVQGTWDSNGTFNPST